MHRHTQKECGTGLHVPAGLRGTPGLSVLRLPTFVSMRQVEKVGDHMRPPQVVQRDLVL